MRTKGVTANIHKLVDFIMLTSRLSITLPPETSHFTVRLDLSPPNNQHVKSNVCLYSYHNVFMLKINIILMTIPQGTNISG